MTAWIHIILEFLVGVGLLTWGADRFITASASIARHLNVPSIVIGMVLVGFGTSFPELVVSALASWHGNSGLAIGNALGSNIANIGLVVGITALIVPIRVQSSILRREFPILLFVSVLVGVLIFNGYLGRLDGLILLVALVIHLVWMIFIVPRRHRAKKDILVREYEKEIPPEMKLKHAVLWFLVGLILLFVASELVVNSATMGAKLLHISDLVIGLTVVAIGTSLPDLAATIMSAVRHEHDIAIGNVVGSNIFNLLAVLMMPAWFAPGKLPETVLTRDYPIVLGFTLVFWLFALVPFKKAKIGRLEAFILLLGFVGYLIYLGVWA